MKQSVLGGLTAAVILSTAGATWPGYAQSADEPRPSSEAEVNPSFSSADPVLPDLATISPPAEAAVSDGSLPLFPEALLPSAVAQPTGIEAGGQVRPHESDLSSAQINPGQTIPANWVSIFPHPLENNQAATIYLRSIPVLTLIGDMLPTLGDAKEEHHTAGTGQDPVARANAIVEQILALAETQDPEDIEARWLADQDAFVVSWNDDILVTLNSRTILPDTTDNQAQDVLQVANRLRRLLGDAPALTRVEGMPEPVRPVAAPPQVGVVTSTLTGMASWYGPGFHGRRSASGEVFNQNALTAAHRTLPFGTRVRVTNLGTGQQVIVRINDRGPFSHGRIIDLSAAAAANIGLRASGVGRVQLEVLSTP